MNPKTWPISLQIFAFHGFLMLFAIVLILSSQHTSALGPKSPILFLSLLYLLFSFIPCLSGIIVGIVEVVRDQRTKLQTLIGIVGNATLLLVFCAAFAFGIGAIF